MYSLVFFLYTLATACNRGDKHVVLVWKDGRAVGVAIHDGLFKGKSAADMKDSLKVILTGTKTDAGILGDFITDWHGVDFEPLIPLSPGLSYDVLLNGKRIARIKVPVTTGQAPKLIAIYPEADTVPDNLLKFYFHFDHPMRTGQVLDHIYLLDKNKDTMQRVFLNLQPELWDKTGTVLTLWLDPGRIKRALVLNMELGNPLKTNESYELVVARNWKDSRGLSLSQSYTKHFTVGERDGLMPDINKWQISELKANTKAELRINTVEPMDHYLLQESITVLDEKGRVVDGYTNIGRGRIWVFNPISPWQAGHYQIQVKARLEDLAGNNLNRVFDRDITKDTQQNKEFFVRWFEVK